MLNRKVPNRAVLGLPVALLVAAVLTAIPASVLTATPASAAAAGANPCGTIGVFGCVPKNLYSKGSVRGLWIGDNGHNNPIFGSTSHRDRFVFNPINGNWGTISVAEIFNECWNTNGSVIGLDSCPVNDTNEWFQFVQHGNDWLIQSKRTGQYVAADRDGGDLYFTTGVNDTSLWSL